MVNLKLSSTAYAKWDEDVKRQANLRSRHLGIFNFSKTVQVDLRTITTNKEMLKWYKNVKSRRYTY